LKNEGEADIMVNVLDSLLEINVSPSVITVLTLYEALKEALLDRLQAGRFSEIKKVS
jgi:superfamily I DNA and/or RNA helicase